MRLVIGISGASGVWLGYKLLQILKSYTDIETYLVITEGAIKNFALETTLDIAEVLKLADFSYANNNLGALIASGSFTTDGMVIVPCSMKTLAGIVHGYAENLLLRSADVAFFFILFSPRLGGFLLSLNNRFYVGSGVEQLAFPVVREVRVFGAFAVFFDNGHHPLNLFHRIGGKVHDSLLLRVIALV